MNTQNLTGMKTFVVGTGGVTRFARVKLDTETAVLAGAGEDCIGIAQSAESAGDTVTVRLLTASGTVAVAAAGTFAANATVYGAAVGAVDDVVSGQPFGEAVEAATAAGDIVEIIPASPANMLPAPDAHIPDPAAAAAVTQDTLTDSSGGAAATTLPAAGAATTATLTDSSGGTAADTVAAIGGTYAQGEVANAVATFAREQAACAADIASVRAEDAVNTASIAAQMAKVKTDIAAGRTGIAANNTAIDAILVALELAGIVLSS